jgi:hypothetical protein
MTPSMKTCLSTLPKACLNGHPWSMGWITGNSWFDLWMKQKVNPIHNIRDPPSPVSSEYRGPLPWPWRGQGMTMTSIQNDWSCISVPPYAFMAWLTKHSYSYTPYPITWTTIYIHGLLEASDKCNIIFWVIQVYQDGTNFHFRNH